MNRLTTPLVAAGHAEHLTLQAIAARLGVSRTTVSNAYNQPKHVSPALRQQILTLAHELGYAGPHPAARSLRRGRSGAFGVLFTEALSYAFTDPAAVLFLQGVAEVSEATGAGLVLLPAPPAGGPNPAAIRASVVDGFLIYSLSDDHPGVAAALERQMPTVVADEPESAGLAFVGVEDRAGARAAAEHLLGLGHERFAVLTTRLAADDSQGLADLERQAAATFAVVRARLGGYADALRAVGLDWAAVPVHEVARNTREAGFQAATALLARRPRPTALLALTDQLALGALQAARDQGLRVPAELSVVGFDDIADAVLVDPPLTTVRQPLLEKGRLAARLLLDQLRGAAPVTVRLPAELVVRGSSGPAP